MPAGASSTGSTAPTLLNEATVAGAKRRAGRPWVPPVGRRRSVSEGPQARVEALAKLKALFDAGVLTAQQFADERARLLGG